MMLGLVVLIGLHRQFERPFQPLTLVWDLLRLHAGGLIGIALLVFLTQIPLNRSVVGLFLVLTFVLMLLSRLALQSWRRRRHASGEGRTHLLLISNDPSLVALVASSIRDEPLSPMIIGVLAYGPTDQMTAASGAPSLGAIEDLPRVLHEQTVDEVVLATHGMSPDQFEFVIRACDELGTPMRHLVLPEFHDGRRLGLERQYGLPFVTLAKLERSTEALAIKRVIDLIGSACLLARGRPADAGNRRADPGDDGTARALRPGPQRIPRQTLPHAQVPVDDARRGATPRCARPAQ